MMLDTSQKSLDIQRSRKIQPILRKINQSIETEPKITQKIELIYKDISSYFDYITCVQETRGKSDHIREIENNKNTKSKI